MSETYGTTGTQNDDPARELGAVEVTPAYGTPDQGTDYGTDTHGTDTRGTDTNGTGGVAAGAGITSAGPSDSSGTSDTTEVAKEEARATGEQAKEGARHVAEVGKDEVKNVAQETTQQAKELWEQTRRQLVDQSAEQQTRVAEGLRSLSHELSGMAKGSEQQGVASDLAQQASTRMDDVASWLDQRDPGSLVSEVKQFARQRPGTFLAAAAVIGLVGGRLSRGLVAEHQDQDDTGSQSGAARSGGVAEATPTASTGGYSAYGSSPSGPGTATGRGELLR